MGESMSLILKVAELQKQIAEAKRKKMPRFTIPMIESLDENGEKMLDVLGMIQPGDAERIRTVLLALQDPMWASCTEVLERMRELCLKMEES
jgi:hypothetical protein